MTGFPGAISNFVEKVSAAQGWRLRGLGFLLGALLSLAFAPFGVVVLPFLILPVVLVVIEARQSRRQVFKFGWWFGFGHFVTSLYWVGISFLAQSQVPTWGAPLAVIALAYALAYYFAFAFSLYHAWNPRGWDRAIKFAVTWVVFEWLRGHLFTGFPWNLTANVWFVSDSMMQATAYLGSYGLSFVTVFCAAALVAMFDGPAGRRRSDVMMAGISMGLIFLMFVAGAWRLKSNPTEYYPDIRLRLIQASIPQTEKWLPEKRLENFHRHIDLSVDENGGLDGITHVIWPETSIPYWTLDREAARRFVLAKMLGNRVTLIAGAPRSSHQDGELRIFNSMYAISLEGDILATYDKAHLVPFGEYVPLRAWLSRLGLAKLVPGALDFSSGPGRRSIKLPGLPAFSPLICYEVIFPGNATDPQDRPGWMLNLTNDAWFGTSPGPYQHFAISRFRALEEGMPVVRSAGTGISAFIDSYGRVLGKMEMNASGALDSNLPRALAKPTLYAMFGDLILLVLLIIAGLAVSPLSRRKGENR